MFRGQKPGETYVTQSCNLLCAICDRARMYLVGTSKKTGGYAGMQEIETIVEVSGTPKALKEFGSGFIDRRFFDASSGY